MDARKIAFAFVVAVALLAPALARTNKTTHRVLAAKTKCEGLDCPCSLPDKKCLTSSTTEGGCKPDSDDDEAGSGGSGGGGGGGSGSDCGGGDDEDEGGMDLIKSDPPTKPSTDLSQTLDDLEDWNSYLDKMVNPNPMAAASERAAQLASAMKRKHKQQEMDLSDSNQNLRLQVKGGLMQILGKAATRWEAEQRLSAEADKRASELQAIRDKIKRLNAESEQLRALDSATGGKQLSTKEQLEAIVAAASETQGNPDNEKAFAWLTEAIKGYKAADAAAAPPPKKGSF